MDPNTNVPQPNEIQQAQNVFQRAADAILQLGELRAAVSQLQASVGQMQTDMDTLRRTNNALEEALEHSRAARHELEAKNNQLVSELATAQTELRNASVNRDDWHNRSINLEQQRDEARKERDDAQLRVMDLEDQLKDARKKLDAIREGYASIFGNATPEAAQPAPVAAPSQHDPQVFQPQENVSERPSVSDTADETPEWLKPKQERPARIYEDEPGFGWNKSETGKEVQWDDNQRKWYIEA